MARVEVTGLASEEHMFKESLEGEAGATLAKIEKTLKMNPEDTLKLHVKSHVEGKKKRFEVSARLTANGKQFYVGEPDAEYHKNAWDLHMATKEALKELLKVVEKQTKSRTLKGLTADEALEKRAMK